MRITENMLHARSLRSLSLSVAALQTAQEQVSTNKRLNRPSDDPLQVRQAVTLRDNLDALDQFKRNIGVAQRLSDSAESALEGANAAMIRAKELAIQGANDSLAPDQRRMIAQEVEQLARELVRQGNTRSGDDYVFAGFQRGSAPYTEAPGGTATAPVYAGDAGAIRLRIAPDQTIDVNVTGDKVFTRAFDALAQLHAELTAGSRVSGDTLTKLDAGSEDLVTARATLGARMNRLDAATSSIEDLSYAATKLLSTLEDADMPTVVSELTRRETAYQAALAVTARVLQPSLLDSLR